MAYKQKHPEPQPVVASTGELYVIPCIFPVEQPLLLGQYRRTWPRYNDGAFRDGKSPGPQYAGESLLELDLEERRALQIVELRTEVKKEAYGASHQFNWKKLASVERSSRNSSSRKTPCPRPGQKLLGGILWSLASQKQVRSRR